MDHGRISIVPFERPTHYSPKRTRYRRTVGRVSLPSLPRCPGGINVDDVFKEPHRPAVVTEFNANRPLEPTKSQILGIGNCDERAQNNHDSQ
jgi:hypothetical protein